VPNPSSAYLESVGEVFKFMTEIRCIIEWVQGT